MNKSQNKDSNFQFYDLDPRLALIHYNQEVKEQEISTRDDGDQKIKASPSLLALTIMLLSQNHLKLILDGAQKLELKISKEQKTKLYFELLSLYYFLIGTQIQQYLQGDQFTLFVLKLHVEILDNLPKTRDNLWLFGVNPFTKKKKIYEIEKDISAAIRKGEEFYIRDKLNEDEAGKLERLKPVLLDLKRNPQRLKDYKENLLLQFIIKSYLRVIEVLNLSIENLDVLALYFTISIPILENQKIIQDIKPTWYQK